MELHEQVEAMVAKLTPKEQGELLAKHGSGLPIEQKHAILTQYLATRQQEPPSVEK
jgi:hypothetical protein